MKRVLVAVPLRLGARATCLGALADLSARGVPGWEIDTVCLEGPAINFARNELAHFATAHNYDRIIFLDEDMGVRHEHFVRLLSHPELVVGGKYCVKADGPPKWLFREKPGATVGADGLLECDYVATGLLMIPTGDLRSISENFPDRWFAHREDSDEKIEPRFEWFPMEISGPGTAEERLRRVAAVMEWIDGDKIDVGLQAIRDAIETPQELGRLLGEDYGFCRLARDTGVRLFVDTELEIPHIGESIFPRRAVG